MTQWAPLTVFHARCMGSAWCFHSLLLYCASLTHLRRALNSQGLSAQGVIEVFTPHTIGPPPQNKHIGAPIHLKEFEKLTK